MTVPRGPASREQSCRPVAIRVLQRVCEQAAFASVALDAELSRARCSPRDAALATQIVYGSLRALPALDQSIAAHLRRPAGELDGLVRAALRAGAYQLNHLSRVPAHAVVDETVAYVRAQRGPRVAGFANAVLRKLAADRPDSPEPPQRMLLPPWLEQVFLQALGPERATAALGDRSAPPLGLRVERGEPEALAERIARVRPAAELRRGAVAPRCLLLWRGGDPRTLPGYAEGDFAVQEEGSQVVALCAGAQAGERVAELCAGHGGKSALFVRQVGPDGSLCAVDIDERKLARIPAELARLGIDARALACHAVDLTVGTGGLPATFDRVFVDAPCTGLGTLHRRPELLLRVDPARVQALASLQLAIARRAAELLRPGGTLVYAVCSPLPQEGLELCAKLERDVPALRRLHESDAGPQQPAADADGVIRLGPWLSPQAAASPDMYQVIRWKMSESP